MKARCKKRGKALECNLDFPALISRPSTGIVAALTTRNMNVNVNVNVKYEYECLRSRA